MSDNVCLPVKLYEAYQICPDGTVYRNGVKLKPTMRNGYLAVCLCINGKKKSMPIHRLVGIHFVQGRTWKKKIVNHIDGNKLNNHFSNLEWCSISANTLHAYELGLANKSKKLLPAQIKLILDDPRSARALAEELPVSRSVIQKIRQGLIYRKVIIEIRTEVKIVSF